MSWQDEIVAALGATERTSVPSRDEWIEAEAEIGCKLPEGYKALIDRLGAGRINDFLWLFLPSPIDINIDIADQAKHGVYCYSVYQEINPNEFPRPSPPEVGAAIVFARTLNGDLLSFVVGPGDPDGWHVALCHEGKTSEEILGKGVEDFFFSLVENRIKSRLLPRDFLGEKKSFRSWHLEG